MSMNLKNTYIIFRCPRAALDPLGGRVFETAALRQVYTLSRAYSYLRLVIVQHIIFNFIHYYFCYELNANNVQEKICYSKTK